MHRRVFMILCLIAFVLCRLTIADENSVTLSKIAKWCVVVPVDSIESEKYATDEFISIFKQVSGCELRLVSNILDSGGCIYVGQTNKVKKDDLGEEGLRIKVRDVWQERAIKGIRSEQYRDHVITYQIDSLDDDSVIFSTVLADGSKIKRKIWLDKENPEKICFKTEFTHNADKSKEYQFKIIPQYYYEGYDEKPDYVSTLVLNQGQYAGLKNLMGPKSPVRANVPLNDKAKGHLVLFNSLDGFGLRNDYSNLFVEKPRYWWEYCKPRYIPPVESSKKAKL